MPFRPSSSPQSDAYKMWAQLREQNVQNARESGEKPMLPAWLSPKGAYTGIGAAWADTDPVVTQGAGYSVGQTGKAGPTPMDMRDQAYDLMLGQARRQHDQGADYKPTPEEKRLQNVWGDMRDAGKLEPVSADDATYLKNLYQQK